MRTNIEIDDALMAEATQLSGLRTKRDVVHFVLNRYVKIERQRKALEGLRGDLEAMRTDDPVREWG
jgi:Arc/MetJ family transcription regulator